MKQVMEPKKVFIIVIVLVVILIIYNAADSYIKLSDKIDKVSKFNSTLGLPSVLEMEKTNCISICAEVKSSSHSGILESGPCLGEAGKNHVGAGWVCDVAHNPRQDIDNLPANQCPSFGPGKHFVEVDTDCNFIGAV